MMSKAAESKTTFKFFDAQLLVKRIKPDTVILLSYISVMNTGALTRYNMTRVELKTFTYSGGSKSRYIDNAVLVPVPK